MSGPPTNDNPALSKLYMLKTNFRYCGRTCLKLQTKNPGEVLNLDFNDAQEFLNAAVEQMLAEVGYVRIIIVKGRQQGVSTWIILRFLHKAIFTANTKITIISHEAKSTSELLDRIKFAHSKLPDNIKPELITKNRNELAFPNGSVIKVFTAGEEDTGRSQMAHHQHQSERASFVNPSAVDSGIGQAVALVPKSEAYKESTAKGQNHFYLEVNQALAGKGVWRIVFIPWFCQKEYQTVPRQPFVLDKDELDLKEIYKLSDAQLQWRRDKIAELSPDPKMGLRLFRQEYPNTLMEAFQASGDSFFDADKVQVARKSQVKGEDYSPLILGVDPGRTGDRTVLVLRKGREVVWIRKYEVMETMQLAGIVASLIQELKIDKVFIDYGMGYGTVDRLRERGFGSTVEGVHFSEKPMQPQYANKRAEMNFAFQDWLYDGEVSLPDEDDMAADFACLPAPKLNSRSKWIFPEKEEIKKTFGRSPDILDATILTFAYPVASRQAMMEQADINDQYRAVRGGAVTTLNRVRPRKRRGGKTYYEQSLNWE